MVRFPYRRLHGSFWSTNREIINTLIYDLLENSDSEEKDILPTAANVE